MLTNVCLALLYSVIVFGLSALYKSFGQIMFDLSVLRRFCLAQVCLAQVCLAQVCLAQVCLANVCLAQVFV